MSRQAYLLLVAVLTGVFMGALIAWKFATDPKPSSVPPDISKISATGQLLRDKPSDLDHQQLARVVESLIQLLDAEISERRVLAEQLESVQTEMAELQRLLGMRSRSEPAANADNTPPQSAEERLLASGFTPRQIETVRRRDAEAQMRQIDLDDRARREGWLNTPRFYDEFNKIQSGTETIREELGDDAYDRYLYASGQPNRLVVGTVIKTSPAEQAGLRRGDIIRSYDGERVFTPQQLIELRSAGVRGSPVTVEVIRDGGLVQLSMPRGPMGVQHRTHRANPNSPDGAVK